MNLMMPNFRVRPRMARIVLIISGICASSFIFFTWLFTTENQELVYRAMTRNNSEYIMDSVRSLESSINIDNYILLHMQARLPSTLKQYKNPCWFEKYPQDFRYRHSYYYRYDCQEIDHVITDFDLLDKLRQSRCNLHEKCSRLRCYPYFFVAGAPKCGTTDLYASLTEYHPHIVSGTRKESQFWVRRRLGLTSSAECPESNEHKATFPEYLDLYDIAAEKLYEIRDNNNMMSYSHPAVTGDFTPDDIYYLWNWTALPGNQGQTEPKITLAHHLHSLAPHTKVIFMLRDPVQRLNSHLYFRNKYMTQEECSKKAMSDISDFQKCLQSQSPRHCAYTMHSELTIGLYSIFVKDWLAVFPKNQVLVLKFEDYKANRQKPLAKIVQFLELDPALSQNDTKILNIKARLNTRNNKRMETETLQLLREFYRPYNDELADILGEDKWKWHD